MWKVDKPVWVPPLVSNCAMYQLVQRTGRLKPSSINGRLMEWVSGFLASNEKDTHHKRKPFIATKESLKLNVRIFESLSTQGCIADGIEARQRSKLVGMSVSMACVLLAIALRVCSTEAIALHPAERGRQVSSQAFSKLQGRSRTLHFAVRLCPSRPDFFESAVLGPFTTLRMLHSAQVGTQYNVLHVENKQESLSFQHILEALGAQNSIPAG